MKTQSKLEGLLRARRCTLLGVGPVSRNSVDATVELANEFDLPLMLIASRRQIDTAEFGGGYVNRWTTEAFSEYVSRADPKKNVILARDHGGPWQNNTELERKLNLREAMESAKRSYTADLRAGFSFLHIDPSIDPAGTPKVDAVFERILELYEHCWSEATRLKQDVVFEIGTEEQSGAEHALEELEYTLARTGELCRKAKLPAPMFVVVQTGTKVKETRNVGTFRHEVGSSSTASHIRNLVELCRRHGVWMKEHNADYLSNEALAWHPELGIHAANVAPEFGVVESRALLSLLDQAGLRTLRERFIHLAHESRKWEKWMLGPTSATIEDRAVICGHYVFSDPRCLELKAEADRALVSKGVSVDAYLKDRVKEAVLRYVVNFNLVDAARVHRRRAA